MTGLRRRLLALSPIALVLASCYSPSIPSGKFSCDPSLNGADCPDGFVCAMVMRSPRCVDPSQPADGAGDMSVGPSPAPDGTGGGGDGPSPEGLCQEGGTEIVRGRVWACKGAFTGYAAAAALCIDGSHVCDDGGGDIGDRIAIYNARSQCSGLAGFFIAKIGATGTSRDTSLQTDCQRHTDQPVLLVGCGKDDAARSLSSPGLSACAAFPSAISCMGPGASWSCPNNEPAHPAGAPGGVLCCK